MEFKAAAGEALAISIPRAEAPVIRYLQARMPHGLVVPTFHEVKESPGFSTGASGPINRASKGLLP